MKKNIALILLSMTLSSLALAQRVAICDIPGAEKGVIYLQTQFSCPQYKEIAKDIFTYTSPCKESPKYWELKFASPSLEKQTKIFEKKAALMCFIGKNSKGKFIVEKIVDEDNFYVEDY